MVSPTEALPLVIAVLLLVSASGASVDRLAVQYDGEQTVDALPDVLVVAGGEATVPSAGNGAENGVGDGTAAAGNTQTGADPPTGDIYVAGGDVVVAGTLQGDVTVLAGNLTVTEGATITGGLSEYGGSVDVAAGASVGERTGLPAAAPSRSVLGGPVGLVLQALLFGLLGAVLARRRPQLLATVGDAITGHAVVSGVVGTLTALSLLVLFVLMAFTIVLLPLAIVGLLVELAILVYAYAAYGHLLGGQLARRLPVGGPGFATGIGVAAVVVGVDLLGRLPLLGGVLQVALAAVGFGAVVITYFGVKRFEPPTIPGGEGA